MASAVDIQALLRFLTKDAKVPLAMAMSKVKDLKEANLTSSEAIAKSDLKTLSPIFNADDKVARSVFSAAKRLSKKREAGDDTPLTPSKRRRNSADLPVQQSPQELEASIQLPSSQLTIDQLQDVVLTSNRAPLLLAFAYSCLKFTMPDQPDSSRLSLAQAVVSTGSRAKAVSIGLAKRGDGAEEQGWGEGQPVVKVMGRDIKVLRRWGYEWKKTAGGDNTHGSAIKQEAVMGAQGVETESSKTRESDEAALWALDLEQLKQLNGPVTFAYSEHAGGETSGLPIYSPQAARSYVLRAFETYTNPAEDQKQEEAATQTKSPAKSKRTAAVMTKEKEENAGKLLKALELAFESWAGKSSKSELDQKAWNWYVRVRPDVEHGVAGWGAKGQIRLSEILDLRRRSED